MARLFDRLRWLRALLGVLGVLGGCCAVVTVSTSAAADAKCTSKRGVLVVVDFGELGGGVQRGCAPGDPKTGLKALRAAGFSAAGTGQYGLSFVCRIDGEPGKAREKCVDTPPGDAHWAYWHGGASGWTQSRKAVTGYDPKPGAIEGWSFGDGARPRTPVASARSASSESKPAPPSASAGTSSSTASAAATQEAGRSAPGGGLPVSTIVAVIVVVGGGLVAGLVAWRRRRGS